MATLVSMWIGMFVFVDERESSVRSTSEENSNIRCHAVFGNRMEGEERIG